MDYSAQVALDQIPTQYASAKVGNPPPTLDGFISDITEITAQLAKLNEMASQNMDRISGPRPSGVLASGSREEPETIPSQMQQINYALKSARAQIGYLEATLSRLQTL